MGWVFPVNGTGAAEKSRGLRVTPRPGVPSPLRLLPRGSLAGQVLCPAEEQGAAADSRTRRRMRSGAQRFLHLASGMARRQHSHAGQVNVQEGKWWGTSLLPAPRGMTRVEGTACRAEMSGVGPRGHHLHRAGPASGKRGGRVCQRETRAFPLIFRLPPAPRNQGLEDGGSRGVPGANHSHGRLSVLWGGGAKLANLLSHADQEASLRWEGQEDAGFKSRLTLAF